MLLYVCLLCLLVGFGISSPLYQFGFPPNEHWKCNGCGDVNATGDIFGMVRHALYTQSRDVYLPFGHSWIDTLLGTGSHVVVTIVARSELANYAFPAYYQANLPQDEIFQIIVSLPSSKEAHNPLNFVESEVIDRFLTHNPCWIPIHEPPIDIKGLTHNPHPNNIFDYSAIFVQMPSYPFYATCLFYKLVTKMQFPAQCPTANEVQKIKQYPLGNIGWSNLIHPLYEHFRGSLRLDKLFINPRAFSNGPPSFTQKVNGIDKTVTGVWKWANRDECDPDTFAWNPYHCLFMSITNCNTPELHDVLPDDENWRFTPDEYDLMPKSNYFAEREKIKSFRSKYGDAPGLGNEWEDTRLLAYVVRPNAAMRYRLRRQLQQSVVVMRAGMDSSGQHNHLGIHGQSFPVLGLHIRHGDSLNDFRGQLHVDRSLERHVHCAAYFARQLGVNHVYLATDNATLFSLAPKHYPEYTWLAQERTLKPFNGHSFEGYFNENSVHQDVANILVDLLMLSRSVGLIGARDSGFYVLVSNYQCMRSKGGSCPPTLSLEECTEKHI